MILQHLTYLLLITFRSLKGWLKSQSPWEGNISLISLKNINKINIGLLWNEIIFKREMINNLISIIDENTILERIQVYVTVSAFWDCQLVKHSCFISHRILSVFEKIANMSDIKASLYSNRVILLIQFFNNS